MTNQDRIIKCALENDIYTRAEIDRYLEEGIFPLRSKKSWTDMGYVVPDDEKPILKTRLWLYRPGANNKDKKQNFSFVYVPLYSFEQIISWNNI